MPLRLKLIVDRSVTCSTWFAQQDMTVRGLLGMVRAIYVTKSLARTCLQPQWCMKNRHTRVGNNPEARKQCKAVAPGVEMSYKGSDLGEMGRRGGGLAAVSGFSLGGSSNRAGNDE